MNKKLIALAVASLFAAPVTTRRGVNTADTNSMAFQFRMSAGFAGDINRTHPSSVEPVLLDSDHPFPAYGRAGIMNAVGNTIRPYSAAEASDATDSVPWGLLVRAFPIQAQSATNYGAQDFGDGVPPTSGEMDFLRAVGYIMVKLNANVAAPVKGGRIFIWCAADSGDHLLGGYETAFSAGNTVRLSERFRYNGPPDSNGVTEVSIG